MERGNKGEWSEVYTLLKLLADQKLYAADSNLEKIPNIYYPLVKILRQEIVEDNEIHFEYGYSNDTNVRIVDGESSTILELPLDEFRNRSLKLLEDIRLGQGRSFEVSKEISDFLRSINVTSVRANSETKRDITIVVHDIITGLKPTLGFSIKSRLGKPASLLNASKQTNFIFRVIGDPLPQNQLEEANAYSRIRDRIQYIMDMGRSLEFFDMQNEIFKSNLQIIDSSLPEIMAHLLQYFYSGSSSSNLSDLLDYLTEMNPCNFNDHMGHPFYEYKIKTFLIDVALGLRPTNVWQGSYDANGGYIVVKEDGELVCYHIYNRNEFQKYLLINTKLEQADRDRNIFGDFYTENNQTLMKLNLQVRFK